MYEVPQHILDWRRKTGVDRFDETWSGVIHMNPTPNRDHEELALDLYTWLRRHWAGPQRAKLFMERNVAIPGGSPQDYRVPDLVLMTSDRIERDKNEYLEGAPTVVVEIRSPGDESYEKLPFYADLDVVCEAGAPRRTTVRTFRDIDIRNELDLRFTPRHGQPILSGIEVSIE
jgi:Uma2 family endonuclease